MKKKYIMLLSLLVLIVAMATVSAADSDNSAVNDNSGSDVAVDSSSSTSQATDTSTHTDSSVDKTSDVSATSSQKTDTTSQQTTQKVSDKTSENTQTTSDTTTKDSSDTTVKDSSDTTSQSTQSTSQSTQQIQSNSNTTNENTNTVNEKIVDTNKSISTADEETLDESQTFNITQDNYQDYFTNATDDTPAGLSDLVNDGDVLNLQGDINVTYQLVIDKAVNLTSLDNTGRLVGDGSNQRRITITEAGSNTNVTNITVYDMEFFTSSAHNLTFDNFNLTNVGIYALGHDTGVFSMRDNSSNITITNSYFYTENNGGSSTLVSAGASHVLIDNCTVEGVGTVGNLVYLTTYNTAEGTTNGYINITNNRIIGPEESSSICWAVAISGTNVIVANNFINYTGSGIVGQWGTTDAGNNYCYNNTVVGTGISLSGADIINNTAEYISNTNGSIINNTVESSIGIIGDNVIVANNTINGENATFTINSTNSLIENNTFNTKNITINIIGSNNTINFLNNNDFTFDGNLTLNITGSAILGNFSIKDQGILNISSSNNTLDNITILGDSIINIQASNNILTNININNNSEITNTASNNVLENITIGNDAVININSSENQINNITVNGNSEVNVNGDSNTITNSTFVKTTTVLMNSEKSQHVIVLNGVNNTVTYNNLTALDLFNNVVNNGDDAVSNSENNIVHDNYGNGVLPDDTRTQVIYEITSFEELKEVLSNIKANETLTSDEIVVINFKDGDYTATESLTWDNTTGSVNSIIFNGTDQVITAQDLSLFITVGEGYNLTINNLTLKDFSSGSDNETIVNYGTLYILNSTFDNTKKLVSNNNTLITIIGNIFKNYDSSSILSISSLAEIVNNTFQDTKGSDVLINIKGDYILFANNIIQNIIDDNVLISYENENGELIFENNTITNTTASITLWSIRIDQGYIRNNIFTDNNNNNFIIRTNNKGTIVYIYNNTFSDNNVNSYLISSEISDVSIYNNSFINFEGNIYIETKGSITNNTFINGTGEDLFSLRYPSSCDVADNIYINCLPVNFTGFSNETIESEDYTATITLTTSNIYDKTLSGGSIIVYINDEEYKTFEVEGNQATITLENSALGVYKNNITLKYIPIDEAFFESTVTFTVINLENAITNEYNVTSFEELKQALEEIKATTDEAVRFNEINLLEGNYTVTESLTFDDVSNYGYKLTINGNNQTLNLNGNTFITVAEGYNLIITNLNLENTAESSVNSIINNGNLTITESSLNNTTIYSNGTFIIDDASLNNTFISIQKSLLNATNSNFTNTAFNITDSNASVSNNYFYDTDASQFTDLDGMFYYTGTVLQFFDNNINNVTGKYILYSGIGYESSDSYIHDNTFSNTYYGIYFIYSDLPADTYEYMYDHGHTQIINNTFINSTYTGRLFNSSYDLITYPDLTTISNNTYENCNLGINISTIPDSTTKEDFTTTVTLTADSVYNTTVNDGKVIVYVNGKEYESFDVSNGQATITIEASELELFADNNIEVKYATEDGTITNATTSFTLTLKMDDGIIVGVNQTTIYAGDTVTLTAQVAHNDSLAKDGYVIFKVNGKTIRDENGNPIKVQVDENGMATLNYTIPDTNSNEYNITAVYNGKNTILRSTETITTTLKKATIIVNPITAKAGQTVTLRAYITDQNGNAVTTGKLIFKLNGKTLKDENGNTLYATIVNGVATLNYTIPDNYSAKDYILTAVYQGTGFERSESNSTLTLTKSTPTIIPDSSVFGTNNTITINQGDNSIQVKATIYDPETNAPINTTTVVTIKINDKTVTQQYVTDGQIDIEVFTSSFKNPEYNITVVVGENSIYERTSFNGTLVVNPMNTLVNETSYNGTLLVKED